MQLAIGDIGENMFGDEVVLSYTSALLFILLLLQGITKRRIYTASFSMLDMAIMLYVAYCVSHVVIIGSDFIDASDICKWGAALAVYVFVRGLSNKRIVLYVLILSGVVEAITAIMQQTGWIASEHLRFDVVGHLGNPGPLGGYLGICLVMSSCLLWKVFKDGKRGLVVLGISIVIILTVGIILADSRAAVVGVLGGILFLLPLRCFRLLLRWKKRTVCLGILIVIVVGILFYQYRPQSADARLLVGKVAIGMVKDSPLLGHGIGAFKWKYMLYQAHYFERHDNENEKMVADNVGHAYNEFLHLAVEIGIVGLLITLFILGSVYIKGIMNTDFDTQVAKAGLLVWIVFSMFSYPVDVFPLLFLLPLLLGCLQQNTYMLVVPFHYFYTAFSVVLLLFAVWTFRQGIFYQETSRQLSGLSWKKSTPTLEFMDSHYLRLKSNVKFSLFYHHWLSKCASGDVATSRMKEILPTSESYCWLGDYYCRIGYYKEAEAVYQKASLMVPTRFRPRYKLWKLYREMNDSVNATKMAQQLLSQQLKVENSFTINAKWEIQMYLDDISIE